MSKLRSLQDGNETLQHDASSLRDQMLQEISTIEQDRARLAAQLEEQARARQMVERRSERLDGEIRRARAEVSSLTAELAKAQQIGRVARNLKRQGGGANGVDVTECSACQLSAEKALSREKEKDRELGDLRQKLTTERAWVHQLRSQVEQACRRALSLVGGFI
jgi:hypothetical protein